MKLWHFNTAATFPLLVQLTLDHQSLCQHLMLIASKKFRSWGLGPKYSTSFMNASMSEPQGMSGRAGVETRGGS